VTDDAGTLPDGWYRAIFDDAPCGILVFDRNLRVLECNPRFVEWIGTTRERLLGFDLETLRDQRSLPSLREAVAGRRGRYEGPYKTTETERLLMIRCLTAPLTDRAGRHLGGIASIEDLSDRRATEAALEASDERYRSLIELAPDPIFVQVDRKIVYANPATARSFGASSPAALLGRSVMDFVAPEMVEAVASRIAQALAGEPVEFMPQRFVRLDGSLGDAEVRSIAMTFEGQPAAMTVARDVSDRRAHEEARADLEEQLRQAQKMEAVGLLAGGVAHDFNNLLTVISFYAKSLQQGLPATSPLAADAVEIEKAAARAAALTRQLLAFSRKQVLQPRVLDVNTVLDGLRGMLARIIGEDIRVVLVLGSEPCRVRADPGQLEQVIMNLAVNARDAMRGGGELRIECSAVTVDDAPAQATMVGPGRYARIAVHDSGHGMDAATRARIFEPFFTTKEAGRGTGLGLSTVYGIVRQSGGGIRVESAEGKGTTFEILLPLAAAEVMPVHEPPPPVAVDHARELVLVVEDEDAVRKITRRILEDAGYRVVEARDGRHALDVAAALPGGIDLLVTDMVMPELGGAALYAALVRQHPALPVVFLSGYTDDELLRRGDLARGSAFLQKPFSAESLTALVREVLDRPRE
jgi:two-component system, cell cycle sensor histidine kinase and response regulator CckA